MNLRVLFSRPAPWWTVAGLAGICFCFLAVNNTVYVVTSPPTFDYYVILRKLYSIGAFAVVGYPVARARMAVGRTATLLGVGVIIAAYSTLIEVLQYFLDPPPEGLLSNAIDIVCGLAGGVLAAWIALRFQRRSR